MHFAQEYQLLNPLQRSAVDHGEGPMLVLAGAGTGKTHSIALRIAKLLQDFDLQPNNILCLTFTETGVTAMRQRLVSIIGQAGYFVKIHTFHSFCNDVIQSHPEQFLFTYDLAPLRDLERITLLRDIIDDLQPDSPLKPFAAPYYYINDITRAVQTLKREHVTLERYQQLVDAATVEFHQAQTQADRITVEGKRRLTPTERAQRQHYQALSKQLPKQHALISLYRAYAAGLHKRGRYDYEDMLLFVVDAWQRDPVLLAEYQEQYQFVLVDEYQDTNGAQNELIRLLGSGQDQPNIFVVGDDRQSIYRFQGASLENILFFHQLYQKTLRIVSLRDNYRSQQTLLDAAQTLIEHNRHNLTTVLPDISQTLVAAKPIPPQPIQLLEFDSGRTEYFWVAQTIQRLIAQGVPPADMAVLYRNNSDVDELIDILERLNVPFRLVAGLNILQDRHIQQLITVLRWLAHPGDDQTLFYLVQYAFWQLPALDITKLTHYSQRTQRSFFTVLSTPADLAAAGVTDTQPWITLTNNLARWRKLTVTETFSEWFDKLLEESGYKQWLLRQPEQLEHLNRLNTLFDEMTALNRSQTQLTPEQFVAYLDLLEQHSLVIEEHELQTHRQAVQLLTAHRAKGLEFTHVFIIKTIDKHWGNVPERSALKLPKGILQIDQADERLWRNEDERRLFYVALTRAKEQVYISYAKSYTQGRSVMPALFLNELPATGVQRVDTTVQSDAALQRLKTIFLEPSQRQPGAAERDYVSALVDSYKLSATALNAYIECPRLFYYEHLLRVPRLKTKSFAFGSAVHEALHRLVQWYLDEHKPASLQQLLEWFDHSLARQLLSRKQFQDSQQFGHSILTYYYQQVGAEFNTTLAAEKNFSSFTVMVSEVPLVGQIDRIDIMDATTKHVRVIDYKTGNPDHKSANLGPAGNYHRQLVFYKLLCDNAKGFGYTAVSGEIQFIQPSKQTKQLVSRTYEFTDHEVQTVTSEISDVYAKIKQLDFFNNPDQYCGDCVYCQMLA